MHLHVHLFHNSIRFVNISTFAAQHTLISKVLPRDNIISRILPVYLGNTHIFEEMVEYTVPYVKLHIDIQYSRTVHGEIAEVHRQKDSQKYSTAQLYAHCIVST